MKVWYDGIGAWLISPEENEQERQACSFFFIEASQHGTYPKPKVEYTDPPCLTIGGVQLILGESPDWCKEAINAFDSSHDLVFAGHVGARPPNGSILITIKGHEPQFPLVL